MNSVGPASSQVEQLNAKLPEVAPDMNKPRMPFKTAYVLTREQEDALVEHALLRLEQIENQLGKRQPTQSPRTTGSKDFTLTCDPYSFYGKREKYTARYYNHVQDRVQPNTIFEHSNLTASLSQRITGQMIAKSNSFFYGQPDDQEWFTAEAVGLQDEDLADKVKKYARYVANQCHIKARHAQAVEFAWVRGEAVVKTTHQERFQIYKRTATFLVDESGNPILDAYDDYILQSDLWVAQMVPAPVAPGQDQMPGYEQSPQPQVTPQTTPPQLIPSGVMVLKRDGVTPMPENPIWKTDTITRRLVTWRGPDSKICYYKDFICPIDAEDVQTADLIAHLYDMTAMSVAQMFSGQYGEGDAGVEDFRNAVVLLRNLLSDSSEAKSAADLPRIDFYEQTTEGSPNNPKSQIAECWLTYDADGDGQQEEIMLVMDRRTRAPIFYEYTANVTLRGLRPFEVIRPMGVDGRWYGMGAMEYFDPEQEFIDLQINRRNFRDGASGRVTFWAPWATLEGQRDPSLKLNNGRTYTLREGYKAEQALSYVTLPEDNKEVKDLIELFMQLMQIKSGVVNGADQQISGLPSANTATGINEVSESGQELFAMFLLRLFPGVQGALSAVVDTIFSQMDSRQVFTYFNGQANEVLELTPDDVRDLSLHVFLSITQQRDRQILQAGNIADQVIDAYYQRPLPLQQRTTQYAQARLKSLRVPQPDIIIEPLDPQSLQPQQPQTGDQSPQPSGPQNPSQQPQGPVSDLGSGQTNLPNPPAPTSMPQPKLAPQYPVNQ
jgi:hypothetical protein